MKYYTTEEVGELWGFKARYIRQLITTKKLKAVKFGTEYRVTQEQLDAYIKENTTEDDPNLHK